VAREVIRKFLLAPRCSSCSTNYASDIPAASRFVLRAACWRRLLRSSLAASSLRSRSAWIFAFDGMTAWLTPEARAAIVGIGIVDTVKGITAVVLIGVFARKVHPLPLGIVFGLAAAARVRPSRERRRAARGTVPPNALMVTHPRARASGETTCHRP